MRRLRGILICILSAAWTLPGGALRGSPSTALHIVVMDPLSDKLACDCVAGYARRNYESLARFLQQEGGYSVIVSQAESLSSPQAHLRRGADLIVGKFSEVQSDARKAGLRIRPLAMLSGKDGAVTLTGLFVVRSKDKARSLEDLARRKIIFGPAGSIEKREAAFRALEMFGLPAPSSPATRESCTTAALAVAEKEADAAVVSSYAMPLLEGCGTIDKGVLRTLARTDPVPFVTVFATARLGAQAEGRILGLLLEASKDSKLLAAMESRFGFIPLVSAAGKTPSSWPDWRGAGRDAISPDVPAELPLSARVLWAHTLTGPGMAGLAAAGGNVVVADKDLDETRDIFRCLDADTGRQKWTVSYAAAGEMDFTNSPRASPVIHDGLVYLLGAFGDLHCVKLDSGDVVWKRNLLRDFGAKRPSWGTCSTPLLVGEKLIVNPGAPKASLVALDRRTGKVVWRTPGDPAGYSSFILASFGGVRQIVGYDAVSLGGWDPETGKRLWRLVPEEEGDYNVPTPIAVSGRLLVATENNGTRLYDFDSRGRVRPEPAARNDDLAPDTSTPVIVDDMVIGCHERLLGLDIRGGLKTLWEDEDEAFTGYCSFIAGKGRVLATTRSGVLFLLQPARTGVRIISRLALFDDVPATERDVWSHPALTGNRLYVRNLLGVYCFLVGSS